MGPPPERTDGMLTVLEGPVQLATDLYEITGTFRSFIPGVVFPVRMTVARIPNSHELVVYSPFDPALVDISSLGTVTAVIAPSGMHSTYAQKFVDAHPGSTLYSSPALLERFPDRDWGIVVDDACAPDVISPHVLVRVLSAFSMFQEVVMLHVASGSVMVADLAFNFTPSERAKMNFGGRLFTRMVRATRPLSWSIILQQLAKSYCRQGLPQLDSMLNDWEWDRFVPCHGAVVEQNAKAVFRQGTYDYVRRTTQEESRSSVWTGVLAVAVTAALISAALKLWSVIADGGKI